MITKPAAPIALSRKICFLKDCQSVFNTDFK